MVFSIFQIPHYHLLIFLEHVCHWDDQESGNKDGKGAIRKGGLMGKNILMYPGCRCLNALTLRINNGVVISPPPIVTIFAKTISTCPEIRLNVKEEDEIWNFMD